MKNDVMSLMIGIVHCLWDRRTSVDRLFWIEKAVGCGFWRLASAIGGQGIPHVICASLPG